MAPTTGGLYNLQGTTWAIAGKLPELTYAEARAGLEALGARVTRAVSSRTDFLVISSEHGCFKTTVRRVLNQADAQLARAEALRLPIIASHQLHSLLNGALWEDIFDDVPAPPLRGTSAQEALTQLRALLHDGPSQECWRGLCDIIDRCGEDTAALIDYAEGCIAAWPEEPLPPNKYKTPPLPLLPDRWWAEVCRGEDHPKLRLVRAISLQDGVESSRDLKKLLACPHLSNVRYLDLGRNSLHPRLVKALAGPHPFTRLTELHLILTRVDTNLARLFHHASLPEITQLSICSSDFTDSSLRLFFEASCWSRLRRLHIEGRCGGDVLLALSEAHHIDRLEHLHGGDGEPPMTSLHALVRRPGLEHLRSLDVGLTGSSPEAVSALLNAPWLETLKHLRLSNTHDPAQLIPLAASPRLGGLSVLKLRGEGGVFEELCANRHLRLNALIIYGPLSADALQAATRLGLLARIEALTVYGAVPEDAFHHLLRSPDAAHLKQLHLSASCVDLKTVEILLESPHLSKLVSVQGLWADELPPKVRQRLADASHLHPRLVMERLKDALDEVRRNHYTGC